MRDRLKSLAHWAYQFTPSVSLHWPLHGQSAGLLLEVAPSLSLFGGLSALLERIEHGLNAMGLACQAGVSLTATSAWWLSQCTTASASQGHSALASQGHDASFSQPSTVPGNQRRTAPAIHITEVTSLSALLPALPIDVLDHAHPHRLTLERCGIHHIRQLMQLPRSGLSRRFGAALLRELDCGFARHIELHTWVQPPPVFNLRQEMPFHTLQLQGLLNVAGKLLEALEHWLQGQWAATRCIRCTFHHGRSSRHPDHANVSVRLVRSAQPVQTAAVWLQLLQDELTRQPLLAEACDISIEADTLEPLQAQSDSLFPGPQEQQQAWSALLGRLHARLGSEQLQTPCEYADPRPEHAHRMQVRAISRADEKQARNSPTESKPSKTTPSASASSASASSASASSASASSASASSASAYSAAAFQPALRLPRPLWFLSNPERLPLQNNRPVQKGPLTFLAGPERIEFGWWNSPATLRDYFIAQDSERRQLWVYRERTEQGVSNRWYLHGLYG